MADFVELPDGNRIPAVGLGTFQGNYDYTVSIAHLLSPGGPNTWFGLWPTERSKSTLMRVGASIQ